MIMHIRGTLRNINAWQIRIIVLTSLVFFIGGSTQVLVNGFAASTDQLASTLTTDIVTSKLVDGDQVQGNGCTIVPITTTSGIINHSNSTRYTFVLHCSKKHITPSVAHKQYTQR